MAKDPEDDHDPVAGPEREPEQPAAEFDEFDDELYDEVKRIASKFALRGPNPTFGATVLVHEAFIRLRNKKRTINSRQHLLALFVVAARCAAVDEIRKRVAQKRLVDKADVDLDFLHTRDPSAEMLAAASEAFDALERKDPTMAAVYAAKELGMKVADIVAEFELSDRTVTRYLTFARGWMEERVRGQATKKKSGPNR